MENAVELESEFVKEQQELIESFKKKMGEIAEDIIRKFYCDITPYAVTDMETNFKNYLKDKLMEEIRDEILTLDSIYSWASSYRISLLKRHKEELQNAIISDLKEKLAVSIDRGNQLEERLRRR